MSQLRFKQVDVFTSSRFKGNPVAVVLEAGGLSATRMQEIANWTNLSETTFVVPTTQAGADYRVRIFTPQAELPFAGHPTLGTAHALLEAGLVSPRDGQLVQECAAGLVRLRVKQEADGRRRIDFELPTPRFTRLTASQVDELEAQLGAAVSRQSPPLLVDVGPRWIVAQMKSAAAVLALEPDFQAMGRTHAEARLTGVTVFGEHAPGVGARVELRSFAPAHGVNEDPVCGSGTGSVGAFIQASGLAERFGAEFQATQGAKLGREGVLQLHLEESGVRVGGCSVTCVDGLLHT